VHFGSPRPRAAKAIAACALAAIALALWGVFAWRLYAREPEPARPRVDRRREPAESCVRAADSPNYQVCVIDESGRPLAGVKVSAVTERMDMTFGEPAWLVRRAGIAWTDATGLATFAMRPRPPDPPAWDLRALGERAGWPVNADTDGTIVLGPPRTVHGRLRFAKSCNDSDTRVFAEQASWPSSDDIPRPARKAVDVSADGSFALEGLGPGSYRIGAFTCSGLVARYVKGSELVGHELELPGP
jgi:hypothetical protein